MDERASVAIAGCNEGVGEIAAQQGDVDRAGPLGYGESAGVGPGRVVSGCVISLIRLIREIKEISGG